MTFQERTALAFARARMVVHGDTVRAMRITRCLDRMEAIALPELVARRALQQASEVPLGEKLALAVRYYATLAWNTVRG